MELKVGNALVCNSQFDDKIGLMAVIDDNLYNHYQLDKIINKEILFDFKMLEFKQNYVFEFEIIFNNNFVLKMHFSPIEKGIVDFLTFVNKRKKIPINLLNLSTGKTISFELNYTLKNDWLSRNILLSKSLVSNTLFFKISNEIIKSNLTPKTYYFVQNEKILHLTFT